MAFRKILAQRLFGVSRTATSATISYRSSSRCACVQSAASVHQTTLNKLAPDPGDDGVCRRYLHRQSAATSAKPWLVPTGEKLLEKLRGLDITRGRIRLDGLLPPPASEEQPEGNLTVADAKKILKLTQLEMLKSRLRQIEKDRVSFSEFIEICAKECSSVDQGLEFAKMLDESGSVIVLGKVVFLRPEQESETNFGTPDLFNTRW